MTTSGVSYVLRGRELCELTRGLTKVFSGDLAMWRE